MASSRPLSSLPLPPSTLAALSKAGYETTTDLQSASAEEISQGTNLSLYTSQVVASSSVSSSVPIAGLSLTQSAASMARSRGVRLRPTKCIPLDRLLGGGIRQGHILEISGPPGALKERLALNIVVSFVNAEKHVLFVDSQNMTTPATIHKTFKKLRSTRDLDFISYSSIYTLTDLMIFFHNLPSYLASHPEISLLVLNSLSFPFMTAQDLSAPARSSLLERIKKVLAQVCGSGNLTVVTTTQLATKLLNADGSAGNFDTGARGVMVPQLGTPYLPTGKSFRVVVAPETRTTGYLRLISSPSTQSGVLVKEPYIVVGETLQ